MRWGLAGTVTSPKSVVTVCSLTWTLLVGAAEESCAPVLLEEQAVISRVRVSVIAARRALREFFIVSFLSVGPVGQR